jgi:hypothetical protein
MTYNMQSAGASASPYVPGRLPVGATEQQVNPNLPPQPSGNPGNGNFPKNLTNLAGDSACFGQVNRPGT